jgi:riboflavin synthase
MFCGAVAGSLSAIVDTTFVRVDMGEVMESTLREPPITQAV